MKFSRKIIYGLVLGVLTMMGAHAGSKTSQTIFVPRNMSCDSAKELSLHNYQLFHSDYDKSPYKYPKHKALVSLEGTGFYQESDSGEELARYFLLDDKTSLNVNEDGLGDIGSHWLGLVTDDANDDNFNSTFSIRPWRRVWGALLNYHVDLSEIARHWWLSILIPIVKVEHDIRFRECDETFPGEGKNTHGDVIATVADALNDREKHFGKFSLNKQSESGIDDMQLKAGWNIVNRHRGHVCMYKVFTIPMGSLADPMYVFSPSHGTARHWGIGSGLSADWDFSHFGKHIFNVAFDFKYRYHFSGTECRSFDLKNGAWTRYLQVVKSDAKDEQLQGINFFTKEFSVRPRSTVDFWSALHWQYKTWNLEVGYDFWWRDAESIRLRCPWDEAREDIGIYDAFTEAEAQGTGISASTATICQSDNNIGGNPVPHDSVFTRVTARDLDLGSARHQSATSHKIFGGTSWDGMFFDSPAMAGFGGSYEFNDDNTAMDNWALWIKLAIVH